MRLLAVGCLLALAQDPPASRVPLSGASQDLKKQEPAQAHPKVDQKAVDEAIKKGVASLKGAKIQTSEGPGGRKLWWGELVLWTYVHAGVPESDERFEALFKEMMERKLETTYNVSLRAMILEELDRVKYQPHLKACAQFLVDNQCKNGQWSYGDPSFAADDVPTGGEGARQDVATSGGKPKVRADGKREKPKVARKVPVKKERDGPASGDNSNSQYAALGLRACHDAGIVLPKEGVKLAQKWWRDAQHDETDAKQAYAGDGWCYGPKNYGHAAYGSMTAGAVGSLAIYGYILGENWKADRGVQGGLEWMAKNFTVTENPGPPEHGGGKAGWMYYYYLYALERAGILAGTEKLGGHEWYPEGANQLLKAQKADGSWTSSDYGNGVWDTCFAILFLRRATRPLEDVATK
jgi:hypothetical protein